MNIEQRLYRRMLHSYYGRFGTGWVNKDRFLVKRGFRGYGKMYFLYKAYGYQKLVAPLIRLQLHYPYCKELEQIRKNLLSIIDADP